MDSVWSFQTNQIGLFTANNLNVVYNQVASNTAAFSSLFGAEYDILTATFDNALNYRSNANESLTVLGQIDQGPELVVTSVPSTTNASQLQEKSPVVDSITSGYSYLLQYVLSMLGLELAEGDYCRWVQVVGGINTRYADLLAGAFANGSDVYATILTYPVTLEGDALPPGQAPNTLARISDYLAPHHRAIVHSARGLAVQPSPSGSPRSLGVSRDVAAQESASAADVLSGELSPGGNFTVSQEGAMNDVWVGQQ